MLILTKPPQTLLTLQFVVFVTNVLAQTVTFYRRPTDLERFLKHSINDIKFEPITHDDDAQSETVTSTFHLQEKPGECPEQQAHPIRCAWGCTYDSDCMDDLKCCPTPCGQRVCRAPVKPIEQLCKCTATFGLNGDRMTCVPEFLQDSSPHKLHKEQTLQNTDVLKSDQKKNSEKNFKISTRLLLTKAPHFIRRTALLSQNGHQDGNSTRNSTDDTLPLLSLDNANSTAVMEFSISDTVFVDHEARSDLEKLKVRLDLLEQLLFSAPVTDIYSLNATAVVNKTDTDKKPEDIFNISSILR